MAVQLDHRGNKITLRGPAVSGVLNGFVLPGAGSAGNYLKIESVASGIATLSAGTVDGTVPSTGTTGHFLRKTSNSYAWQAFEPLPAGGTTGQVLAKTSNTDYAVSWQTVSGGGGIGGELDLGSITDTSTNIDLGTITDSVSTSPLTLQLQP